MEDEPLARRALVRAVRPIEWITLVGEAADGPAATSVIDGTRPDVALMDINLPGYGALTVLERVAEAPAVIFVTAYGDHAAAAFDLAAIDYVLKPYDPGRLIVALERARDAVGRRSGGTEAAGAGVPAPAERARRALTPGASIDTLFVRDRASIVALPLADVVRFEADDIYVAIRARKRRFLVQMALSEVERRLPPDQFLRIHRCHIVNLAHVEAFNAHDGGRFVAVMRDGSTVLASRRYSRAVRALALKRGEPG